MQVCIYVSATFYGGVDGHTTLSYYKVIRIANLHIPAYIRHPDVKKNPASGTFRLWVCRLAMINKALTVIFSSRSITGIIIGIIGYHISSMQIRRHHERNWHNPFNDCLRFWFKLPSVNKTTDLSSRMPFYEQVLFWIKHKHATCNMRHAVMSWKYDTS